MRRISIPRPYPFAISSSATGSRWYRRRTTLRSSYATIDRRQAPRANSLWARGKTGSRNGALRDSEQERGMARARAEQRTLLALLGDLMLTVRVESAARAAGLGFAGVESLPA